MDISPIAPGLYVASRFFPFDDDMPPNPVVIDCTTLRDDDSDQKRAIDTLCIGACTLWEEYGMNVVLVCDAGRNRSAVVAAAVLVWDEGNLGAPCADAIARVREAREPALGRSGGALTNLAFVRYLEGL